jgi:transposase-like protein
MNTQDVFCPNLDCPARGQTGKGNIGIHSPQEARYLCTVCRQTFMTTKGTETGDGHDGDHLVRLWLPDASDGQSLRPG